MTKQLPTTPWGQLPPGMRLLFITDSQNRPGWLERAFRADRATDVTVQEVADIPEAIELLRHRVYDAVLISHTSDRIDALESLDAVRTSSTADQPILVLGEASEKDMAPLCYEAGADAYVCMSDATTRGLLWEIARAIERDRLLAENRRLRTVSQHQLKLEQEEARSILAQQTVVLNAITQIESSSPDDSELSERRLAVTLPAEPINADEPSDEVVDHYLELLRTYVVMGSGNLESEIDRLTAALARARITLPAAMRLHVMVMEKTIQQLGSRSARHVMNRGGLMAMEVLVKLGEKYRLGSPAPWNQGFDVSAA